MYEYKVVPAPKKGLKIKGIKGAEDRFAHALTILLNEQATQGWEYLRCDTLPSETRTGLRSKSTTFQNMLVFRRDARMQPDMADDVDDATTPDVIVEIEGQDTEESHAPALNDPTPQDPGTAPELGPATEPEDDNADEAEK